MAQAALRADGGATKNALLMQFQADILGVPVEVAANADTTALGAAALAGLAVGTWSDLAALGSHIRVGTRYEPSMSEDEVATRRLAWHEAVKRALSEPQ